MGADDIALDGSGITRRHALRLFAGAVAAALAPAATRAAAQQQERTRSDHPEPRPGIDGSRVLSAAQLADSPDVIELFDGIRRIPQIADGIRCYCGCADLDGYRSLLSCFEGAGMARFCEICQGEGRLAVRRFDEGQNLDQIRRAIDARYGHGAAGATASAGTSSHCRREARVRSECGRGSARAAVSLALAGMLLAGSGPALHAQETRPGKSAEWLIASALLAVPEPLRAGAEVRGWAEGNTLTTLRPGTNGIICLADRPGDEGFAAACYHDSLEPFMERGRELTREGVAGAARDETRWREIEAGTLPMPAMAMVFNLRYATDDFDPATFDPATAARLHSFYIRGATPESTGITAQPGDAPWLMHAGKPTAHIMIVLPAKRPEPR